MFPHRTRRAVRLAAAVCLLLGAGGPAAFAQGAASAARDSGFLKECGACHMAFPPQFLPRASWKKIITGLSDHFGEDASLPAKTAKSIEAFLEANAAETSRWHDRIMWGLKKGAAPMRITETPFWVRIHSEEISESVWKDPRVRSKSNCPACHRRGGGADRDAD